MKVQARPLVTEHQRAHRRALFASLAGLALALAACGGSDDDSTSSESAPNASASPASGSDNSSTSGTGTVARGETLTFATTFGAVDLDPKNAVANKAYTDPILAPLIRVGTDGQLQGVLAESWEYVGSDNTSFEITLRPDVQFSDGSPVNADAVVESIKHWATGQGGSWLAGCTPGVKSDLVVQIECEAPNPEIPTILADYLAGGKIVAPASLANPDTLGTNPIGAGPYTLDATKTVPGSSYTYVANPLYFDQDAIHWETIVLKTIPNASTALASLQSGDVDYLMTLLDPNALAAAKSAGLTLSTTGFLFNGVELSDREPSPDNPLGDLKVRQALNYAVDRPAIAKAVYGDFGAPTTQIGVPSQPTTWDPALNDLYPYDPERAKELLAEAGYEDGFTLKVEDQPQSAQVTQAVTAYWEEIGVKSELTSDDPNTAQESVMSQQFPASGYVYGALPMFLQAINWFAPTANMFNPFVTNDPEVLDLISQAAAAPADEQNEAWQAVQAYGVNNAWYVGVATADIGLVAGDNVTAPSAEGSYIGNPIDVTAAS